jgi:hypothetical protein
MSDDVKTLKVHMVTHVASAHSLEVGDVDNHTVALARFSGLAFYGDGTVGPVNFASLTDYTGGAGNFTLFPILSFDDGSELWLKSVGTAKVDAGTRYTPLELGADLVSDYTIHLR